MPTKSKFPSWVLYHYAAAYVFIISAAIYIASNSLSVRLKK